MMGNHSHIDERFAGDELDLSVWFPFYLPHWSSRSESRATYAIEQDGLHLSIPPEQPRWCDGLHTEPMRVSCIQSGSFAGPLGSTIGQQPFQTGLLVREKQPAFRGYVPHFGQIEITMRMQVTSRSMAAFWLVGFEDQPDRSGEICVAEVFGDAIDGDLARVGMGIHAFRDPLLEESFTTVPMAMDVSIDHTYGIDWSPDSVAFMVDGAVMHQQRQAPDYPMQLMIGVFDFPNKHSSLVKTPPVPELIVSHIRGRELTTAIPA